MTEQLPPDLIDQILEESMHSADCVKIYAAYLDQLMIHGERKEIECQRPAK